METSRDNPKSSKTVSRSMREKLAITGLVILLALFALAFKLWKIQDEYSDEYNQKILSQQNYDSHEIPFRRGDILDRNGSYLATSTKVFNLIIDPSQINSNQQNYLDATINLLNEVFGYDKDELKKLITEEKRDSAYVRYAKQISYEKMSEFAEREEQRNKEYKDNGESFRVYGVWFEDSYRRYYPNGSLACNVIGFALSDGEQGSGGIEQYYNDELVGVSGREYGYLNDDSNLERVVKGAEDGGTVISTIDANIQSIVEKYIDEFQQELGSKTTACIVMDPNNGEILAMASNRKYDLNNPRDISEYYSDEELATASDAELSDIWNSIWRNYCVSDTYEPGSTSKIFTVSAALEEAAITGNETYLCDGFEEVSGWKIKCNNIYGHGVLNVKESLMESCNDAMMQIVAELGRDKFTKFLNVFGFGQKTGIDLPGEADTSQLVHSAATMVASDLATNAFGQNYNCTMVQMAAAYASVINGGYYFEPHVVKKILNANGSVEKEITPTLVKQTVSKRTSEFIKDALFATVEEGTGAAAGIAGYEIGGKTGTAEKYPRGEGNYLVSFAGFAPIDNPQLLCYVIVDEPNTEDQAHSTFASSIFRNIMREALPYVNVFRNGDESEFDPADDIDNILKHEETVETLPAETGADGSVIKNPQDELPGAPTTAAETQAETTQYYEEPVQETAPSEIIPETLPAETEIETVPVLHIN